MKTLQGLLARYAHIKAPEGSVRDAFVAAVDTTLGIEIPPEQVRVKNKTATLSVPSVIKHEIHIHKEEILKKVSEDLGDAYALTAIY